jgi:hypothetical protein
MLHSFGEFNEEELWLDNLRSNCIVKVIFLSTNLEIFLFSTTALRVRPRRVMNCTMSVGRSGTTRFCQSTLLQRQRFVFQFSYLIYQCTVRKDSPCFVVNLQLVRESFRCRFTLNLLVNRLFSRKLLHTWKL